VNKRLFIIGVAIVAGSLLAGYVSYKIFEEYLFRPTQLPSIDAIVKREHITNGTRLILVIRNVQNVPITWEEIKIYVKSENATSWTEVRAPYNDIVLGGQEVDLGVYTPGKTIEIRIVYENVVIWSENVKV